MSDERTRPTGLSRRGMVGLGLGLGVAAVVPVACSTGDQPSTTANAAPGIRDGVVVTAFGAVGDGRADDTAAVAKAVKAAGSTAAIHFPAGTYKVTSFPELPNFATVTGAGADLSTLLYEGDGTLITLKGRQRVAFSRLGIFVTGTAGTAVQLSGSFRCSFDAVTLRGNHTADSAPKFVQTRGVVLDENSGGTAFINCDVNNFGIGLTTRCIQNYVTSSKFTNNHVSVLGAGTDNNAGLSLTNVEFVSDGDPRTTATHVKVDGAANDWFLTNVWFEGCDVAMDLGGPTGGPAQFGLVNAKIGARQTGIVLRNCRQPYLANVSFDADTGKDQGPEALRIDPAGCPQGTAVNLVSGTSDDVALAAFPGGWFVIARHGQTGGTSLTPAIMRAPSISDSSAAAPVLRDDDGKYWQLSVDGSGQLTTKPFPPPPPR